MTASEALRLQETLARARRTLLSERCPAGHWRGRLSSSALSTATATASLALAAQACAGDPGRADEHRSQALAGRGWLATHSNADGGFGDTVDSPSNLSTTALVWMALGPGLAGGILEERTSADVTCIKGRAHERAAEWISQRLGGGPINASKLGAALEEVYGEDRTFAVPILAACAIGGAFDGDAHAWNEIQALPFELAVLPRAALGFAGLSVVSYALPALIAIGQAIASHRPSRNPFARGARALARARTLRQLARIQPPNGGFLEATPLTSFVVLALISTGQQDGAVVRRGLSFLCESMRGDGSWPIDTDLATWVTTLGINALGETLPEHLTPAEAATLRDWLLGQQFSEQHISTGAAPGGWAWTDKPGGVPDADDTAGALLALRNLEAAPSDATLEAASLGLGWLVDLQNRDGGIPTFCRGWGRLPFDKSCADLTAHALRAFDAWEALVVPGLAKRLRKARERARRYLMGSQVERGSWSPLWFGNDQSADGSNPVYGTSRILRAARPRSKGHMPSASDAAWNGALERALDWLLGVQATDGGFGGAMGLRPSIEETALALEAMCDARAANIGPRDSGQSLEAAIARAATWLVAATDGGQQFPATPIGLYFAQLWYSERLYPVLFTVSALQSAFKDGVVPFQPTVGSAL